MAFSLNPETLRTNPTEWVVHGRLNDTGPLYVVHLPLEDLKEAVPDLPYKDPDRSLSIRRLVWEQACERAIANSRPMPIYEDTVPGTEPVIRHHRIVLQPSEL